MAVIFTESRRQTVNKITWFFSFEVAAVRVKPLSFGSGALATNQPPLLTHDSTYRFLKDIYMMTPDTFILRMRINFSKQALEEIPAN